ncbi:TetR/AcrR family transcriptional regulator [Geodermatophilus sp. FMUSA9-8]|uniref:TetR/AcrR family transcriptional regulator n=1 Tax=Geodermatophilus sp. FMUSA9-8 TaxID=3120155 RepID=UPI00300AACE2
MSEQSLRARKKALTRAHVLATAQRLFAERGFDAVPIADVAAAADVAVQTVFNHFATKEELYWSGRAPWVTGPADAVRERPAGETPLGALRRHLVESMADFTQRLGEPEGRCAVAALDRSPALRAAERELHHEAERLLAEALEEALTEEPPAGLTTPPRLAARLVAATWLSVTRSLVLTLRDPLPEPADVPALVAQVRATTGRLLSRMQADLEDAAAAGPGSAAGAVPGSLRAV